MVPPKDMERLVQYYKGELTENALLNKAARMAAKRDLLLKSKLPAGIIKAKIKPLSRELHHLTKRVRRGPIGGMGGQMEQDEDDDDDALVTGPMEQVIKKIIKGTPAKKSVKKETPSPATIAAVSSKKKTPTSSTYRQELLKQTAELRQRIKTRRQTEVEKLKTIPGWTTWDKPVKRKLKDDL